MILTQNTLQIQWNPHQNYNGIQYRNRKNNPRTHVETKKNSQSYPKQKKTVLEESQCLSQIILHNHCDKVSMVSAQKQTHKSVE